MAENNNGLTVFQNEMNNILGEYGRDYNELTTLIERMPKTYIQNGQFNIDRTKSSDKVNRDDFIKRLMLFLYDFKSHPNDKQVVFCKKHNEKHYKSCNSTELYERVAKLWESIFRCTPVSEITACVKNIFMSVNDDADIRNRVFCICENLYYIPGDDYNLIDNTDKTSGCYYTLEGPYSVFNEKNSNLIKEYYDKFLGELLREDRADKQFADFYTELPIEFGWAKLWANAPEDGWKDRYWDIIISHSTPYFKKLIEKAYWFDGPTRSGKSTSNKLLRFTFGENNCGGVTMNEYDDPHFNHKLAYCCVNVPDEEKGGLITKRGCSIFKTLSAKCPKDLQVMGSNIPIKADGQFMSFHPTNSNVEWPDGESGPCMKRCLVIFYHNDLSYFDMSGGDFIQDTFVSHPEEYAKYLGTVFALAHYFSRQDKKFFLSPQMAIANEFVASDTDSLGIYYDEFYKYFNGVYNEEFLYEDYKFACQQYGWVQQSKPALKQKFVALLTQKRKPVKLKMSQKSVRCHKLITKNPNADILCPEFEILNKKDNIFFSTAGNLHEGKMSVVAYLRNLRISEQEERENPLDKTNKNMLEDDNE